MTDGSLVTQIGIGGMFSIMVIKEVFAFVGRRNGNGTGRITADALKPMTTALMEEFQRAHRMRDEASSSIVAMIRDGQTKMVGALDAQTQALEHMTTILMDIHRGMDLMGKDVNRHLDLQTDDLLRRIDHLERGVQRKDVP